MLKKILSRLEELRYLHKELSFTDVTIEQISEVIRWFECVTQ